MKPLNASKKFILIYILFLCFEYTSQDDCDSDHCTNLYGIKCESVPGNSCPSNCKPKYVSGTCHDCSAITGSDYYTIDSGGNCLRQCLGDKILGDSGECTYEEISLSGSDLKE